MVTFYVVFVLVFSREYPSGFTTGYRIGKRKPCFGNFGNGVKILKKEEKKTSFLRPPTTSPQGVLLCGFKLSKTPSYFRQQIVGSMTFEKRSDAKS